MKTCSFCDDLSDWKEIDEETNTKHKYKLALVRHSIKGKGRPVDFGAGDGFDLNYCPECGRRLESTAGFTEEGTGKIYTVGITKEQLQALVKDWDNTSGGTP